MAWVGNNAPFLSRKQDQNITIPEDLVPGSQVVQVKAQGLDVRYEILSPLPCTLFSIGRGEGRGVGYGSASAACPEVTRTTALPSRETRLELRQKLGQGRVWGPGQSYRRALEEATRGARLAALTCQWEGGNRVELGAGPNSASPPPQPSHLAQRMV